MKIRIIFIFSLFKDALDGDLPEFEELMNRDGFHVGGFGMAIEMNLR